MFTYYPRYLAIKILKIYQKTLSRDYGVLKFLYPYGHCRFHPTCSEYAIQSIEKYGILNGGVRAFWRILKCNPWNKGGFDPVK